MAKHIADKASLTPNSYGNVWMEFLFFFLAHKCLRVLMGLWIDFSKKN